MKSLSQSIFNVAIAAAFLFITSITHAAIYVKIPDIDGEAPRDHDGWIVIDSFSFGVEREMKESGEKGGTADINIGVGELQECTISKSMDMASPLITQLVARSKALMTSGYPIQPTQLLGDRDSIGSVEVCVADETSATGEPICYLKYKLDRVFIKSWSVSGDADDRPTEEVAFYYNKIQFGD